MMKIEFETKNAAFEGSDLSRECSWILGEIAAQVRNGVSVGTVRDSNGNRVGFWEISASEE